MKTLKTNLTNSLYQSKILPILQSAETEIKKIIVYCALFLIPMPSLELRIRAIIFNVNKALPLDLYDRAVYLEALVRTSRKMIALFYVPVIDRYNKAKDSVVLFDPLAKVQKPIEMLNYLNKPNVKSMWAERKGFPNVTDYEKKLKEKINELSQTITMTEQDDTKGVSIWQKAELDLRHEKQLDMINELKEQGVRYAYTSSHPDCSKRCERWQGKLFDLDAESSELSGFRMRKKIDNQTVYCFKEVISQVQYTKKEHKPYTNNIIVGFNCRHRLIPYKPNSLPPKEYSEKDIKEQREINGKLRQMERTIRELKQKAILYNTTDKKLAMMYKNQAKKLFEEYKAFATKKGYAWYEYRCKV